MNDHFPSSAIAKDKGHRPGKTFSIAGGGAGLDTPRMLLEKEVVLKNRDGLHVRSASLIAEVASNFASEVTFVKDRKEVNAKSIFGIMMLGAGVGSVIKIRIAGNDADKLMRALEALLESMFDEEE